MNDVQEAAKQFEKQVRNVLKLMGFNTTQEVLLGHKKVDLLAEEFKMGRRTVIAIECKHYSKPLTLDDVKHIYVDYFPLYSKRLIDQILIVTRNGLTPAAVTYIDEIRECTHQTLDDLSYDVMDFNAYLSSIINDYEEDSVSQYYVSINTAEGQFAFDHIDDWLIGNQNQPLAILGSYGMGKSTLTRYTCRKLAKRHLINRNERIPILIRLGDISTDQTLEGLLGKELTATHIVRNFSFQLFMELNRQGKFVIFLDGFDEMKHAMTWEEFRFNFAQLNRLVIGDSRVVLLGRPTAFLSDEEYQFCLHGEKLVKGHTIIDSDWPNYEEVQLAAFSRSQVEQFLKQYFAYQITQISDERRKRKIHDIIDNHLEALTGKQLADIARRPVQLKILADVLPQWNGNIDKLTVAGLYDCFIDMVIEREQLKITRRLFDLHERRQFAQELSYWLWTTDKKINITAEGLPSFLFTSFEKKNVKRKGLAEDVIRRDLVAACFLNRKLGGSLYFPHRSFQEFLVAECVIDKLATGEVDFQTVDKLANIEIFNFMSGLISENNIRKWLRGLSETQCNLSLAFLQVLNFSPEISNYYFDELKNANHNWYILLVTLALNNDTQLEFNHKDFHEVLHSMVHGCRDIVRIVMIFFALLMTFKDKEYMLSQGFMIKLGTCIEEICKVGTLLKENDSNSYAYVVITQLLSRVNIYKGDSFMKGNAVNIGGVYEPILKILNQECFVRNWINGNSIRIEGTELPSRLDSRGLEFVEVLKEYQQENFV